MIIFVNKSSWGAVLNKCKWRCLWGNSVEVASRRPRPSGHRINSRIIMTWVDVKTSIGAYTVGTLGTPFKVWDRRVRIRGRLSFTATGFIWWIRLKVYLTTFLFTKIADANVNESIRSGNVEWRRPTPAKPPDGFTPKTIHRVYKFRRSLFACRHVSHSQGKLPRPRRVACLAYAFLIPR